MDRIESREQTTIHTNKQWGWKLPIHRNISRPRLIQSHDNPTHHHHKQRHRHNKHLYTVSTLVLSLLSPTAAMASDVGGISATASPIANSSGSVTNQAIQVLQGPYVTNTYGNGVSCQSTTLNITPYFQFADSRKHPWEDFYNEPQYNLTDISGRTVTQTITVQNYPWETWYDNRTKDDGTRWFADGADMQIEVEVPAGDGVPDAVTNNTLDPIWYKPIRTDMRANQSLNLGISATLSVPLNKKMKELCQQAAEQQIAMQTQLVSNKRLDFEIARLKNCGELKKSGIFFHPASPYHSICADVVVTSPGGQIIPHQHEIPQPKWTPPTSSSSSPSKEVTLSSPDNDPESYRISKPVEESSQGSSEPSQELSSLQVSPPSGANLLGVWQIGQTQLPQ